MSTRTLAVLSVLLLAAWLWAMQQGTGQPIPRMHDANYGPMMELEHAPVRQQRVSDTVCRHLVRRGYPVGPCPRVYVSSDVERLSPMRGVVAVATSTGTVLTPGGITAWGRDAALLGHHLPTDDELRVHTHELLHRLQATRVVGHGADGRHVPEHWSWTAWPRDLEEWAVEAVTLDVLPGVCRAAGRGTDCSRHLDAYAAGVRSFRAISARATGAAWQSRAARSWRSWWVRQDQVTRTAAMTALGL